MKDAVVEAEVIGGGVVHLGFHSWWYVGLRAKVDQEARGLAFIRSNRSTDTKGVIW